MKKQIRLEQNQSIGRLVQNEPFYLTDEKLEIEFITDLSFVLIADVCNGDSKRKMLVEDKQLVIPEEFICEGELQIVISLYDGGSLKSKWHCDPIYFVQTKEQGFELYGLLDQKLREIDELKTEIEALQNAVTGLQKQVGDLWQIQES